MAAMTHRERVERTFRHEEVDRIALYDIIENDAIIERYAGGPATVENGDRMKGIAIARTLDMTRMLLGPSAAGTRVDDEGFTWEHSRWTGWITERPFSDFAGAVDWAKGRIARLDARWRDGAPRAELHAWLDRYEGYMREGAENPDDIPVIVLESGVGLTTIYHYLGWDFFTEMMCCEPALLDALMEAEASAEIRHAHAVADPVRLPVVLTYDDIASKNGLLIDPVWLRAALFPRLKRLIDAWHDHGTWCIYHSDGDLRPVLHDIVDAGADGLNPIETSAGMSVAHVREQAPGLAQLGGIDVSQLLPYGTPDEVRARCEEAIAEANGRGYFLGSTTELIADVPAENAAAMFETPQRLAQGRR
jgi:hypothetical protein